MWKVGIPIHAHHFALNPIEVVEVVVMCAHKYNNIANIKKKFNNSLELSCQQRHFFYLLFLVFDDSFILSCHSPTDYIIVFIYETHTETKLSLY